DLRPSIAVAQPGKPNGAIDLDGRFGLHSSLQALKPLWDQGHLAIVEATGSPDPSRSHFDAQDFMESGTPGKPSDGGWWNRSRAPPRPGDSPLRAIAMGTQLPRTLRGSRPAVAVNNLEQFKARNETAGIFESMYATTADARMGASGRETFEAVKMIETISRTPYTPGNGAQDKGEVRRSLRQVARLIKAAAAAEAR